MKVVGHILGRLVLLFPREEIRPARGVSTLDAFASIRERYNFLHMPDLTRPAAELEQQGYQFSDGTLICDGETFTINEFTIYSDGVSVSSYVTDTAELFFENFMDWAMEEFDVRPFSREPTKIYRSQVTVCFSRPLSDALRGFDKFSELLSTMLDEYTGISSPVDLIRVGVGVDEAKTSGPRYAPFTLERRSQVSFEEEWYFSEAPLPSKVHLKLLEELNSAMLES